MGRPDKLPMDECNVKAMGSIHGLFFVLEGSGPADGGKVRIVAVG